MAYDATWPCLLDPEAPLPRLNPREMLRQPDRSVVGVLPRSMHTPDPDTIGGEDYTERINSIE